MLKNKTMQCNSWGFKFFFFFKIKITALKIYPINSLRTWTIQSGLEINKDYPELPFVWVSIRVFFCCQLALRWSEDSLKHNAGAKGTPQEIKVQTNRIQTMPAHRPTGTHATAERTDNTLWCAWNNPLWRKGWVECYAVNRERNVMLTCSRTSCSACERQRWHFSQKARSWLLCWRADS